MLDTMDGEDGGLFGMQSSFYSVAPQSAVWACVSVVEERGGSLVSFALRPDPITASRQLPEADASTALSF